MERDRLSQEILPDVTGKKPASVAAEGLDPLLRRNRLQAGYSQAAQSVHFTQASLPNMPPLIFGKAETTRVALDIEIKPFSPKALEAASQVDALEETIEPTSLIFDAGKIFPDNDESVAVSQITSEGIYQHEHRYVKIARELLDRINKGVYDRMIPPEHELMVEFGHSRPTVRQALHTLVGMGVIIKKQGVGTLILQDTADAVISPEKIEGTYKPRYQEIAEALERDILRGRYPDRIPTRNKLTKKYNCSIGTIINALRVLKTKEAIVTRKSGNSVNLEFIQRHLQNIRENE